MVSFYKGQYLKGGFRPDLKQNIPTPFGSSDLSNFLHTLFGFCQKFLRVMPCKIY